MEVTEANTLAERITFWDAYIVAWRHQEFLSYIAERVRP
jgi:hypothetical protein